MLIIKLPVYIIGIIFQLYKKSGSGGEKYISEFPPKCMNNIQV